MDAIIWAPTVLAVTGIIAFTVLRAWRGWLELRRHEVDGTLSFEDGEESEVGARIELADIKERLRRLEAIARGVDL